MPRLLVFLQQAGGGAVNVQGEEQKKLDVISNDVLKNALRSTGTDEHSVSDSSTW